MFRGYVGKSCRGSRDFSLIFRSVGSLTLRFIQPKLSSFREDEQEKFTNRTEFAAKVTHIQDEFGMAKGFVDIPILYCLIHVVSGIWITTISRHLSPHASCWWHPLKFPKKGKHGLCLQVESARALRPAEAPVILSSGGSNKILSGMFFPWKGWYRPYHGSNEKVLFHCQMRQYIVFLLA